MIFSDSYITMAGRGTAPENLGSVLDFTIDPFDQAQVNPSSYDLTLYPKIKVEDRMQDRTVPISLRDVNHDYLIDDQITEGNGYTLQPGAFILASSREFVNLGPTVAARVEGKSSLARMGLAIHVTGGFIDPGFQGQITLEIINLLHQPLVLWPNMRIAQIAFMPVMGEVEKSYAQVGHYQGQEGPTLSRYRAYPSSWMTWYFCPSCSWEGQHADWIRRGCEERHCGSCGDYTMCCPEDHCLECGTTT